MIATLVAGGLGVSGIASETHAQAISFISKPQLRDRNITDAVISDDGSTVLAISTVETADNPYRSPRLVRWDPATETWAALSQLSARPVHAVSDDGQTVAFLGPQTYGIQIIDLASGTPPSVSAVPTTGEVSTLAMSGDGGTIYFVDNTAFATYSLGRVSADGSGAGLLVADWDWIGDLTVSDDGSRIAFVGSPDGAAETYVWAMEDGDAAPRQLSPEPVADDAQVASSGGGTRVAWTGIHSSAWDGSQYVTLGTGRLLDLNETGTIAFRLSGEEIQSVSVANPGAVMTLVAGPIDGEDLPDVAEEGDALLFRTAPVGYPGIPDPDGSGEWVLTDGRGDGAQAITQIVTRDPEDVIGYGRLGMSPDGELVVAQASYAEGNAIVVIRTDGSGESRLSDGRGPVVTDDGQWIYYDAPTSLVDPTCTSGRSIYRMRSDGSDRSRIYPPGGCSPEALTPRLARDAGRVYFRVDDTVLSTTLDGGDVRVELAAVSADLEYLQISGDGGVIVWSEFGFGPGQIVDLDGLELFGGATPGVSRDGAHAVYHWNNELGYPAIFSVDVATGQIDEISSPIGGRTSAPQISGDGQWVIYYSPGDPNAFGFGGAVLARVHRPTGTIERVSGTMLVPLYFPGIGYFNAMSHDGSRIAIRHGAYGQTGRPAGIYLADMHATPMWELSRSEPFVLSWSDDPRAAGYDAIRGDLAALATAPDGTTDLGTVTCLVDDADGPSATEDPAAAIPQPGTAYFYVFRSALTGLDGGGSYGTSSAGGERVPTEGGCPDIPSAE